MTIVRLDLAYHGGQFAGWAAQPGLRTVEAELQQALAQLFDARVALTVAGRTDAGVHAWGQVASFEAPGEPPEALARALNALTGDDLVIKRADPAEDGFDARGDARSRTYCYRLLAAPVPDPFERGLSLFWPYPLDLAGLERCAQALLGRHDFTAFTPTQSKHVRFEREVERAEWRRRRPEGGPGRDGELLEFWIEAGAFMHKMVRVLVGTMLEVAGGRRDQGDFERLLAGAPRDDAGDTAHAHGLFLASVRY